MRGLMRGGVERREETPRKEKGRGGKQDDGWVDGWGDRWMDGWVDGWMGGWMNVWGIIGTIKHVSKDREAFFILRAMQAGVLWRTLL